MFKQLQKTEVLSAVNIPKSDINTDALAPGFTLKSVKATGYEIYLFDEWRFKDKGNLDKRLADRVRNDDFELNAFERQFKKTPSMLIVGPNFGSGSSREAAVWGLVQYGIKAVISYSDGSKAVFADIFRNNSAQKGLLLIELPKDEVLSIKEHCESAHQVNLEYIVEVDIENQYIILPSGKKVEFDIDARTKKKLLNGLDDADEIKADYSEAIRSYEERILKTMPFLMEPIKE